MLKVKETVIRAALARSGVVLLADLKQVQLSYACKCGDIELAKLSIEGNDLNIKNTKGQTLLEKAILHDHVQVARLLILNGARDDKYLDFENGLLRRVRFQNHDGFSLQNAQLIVLLEYK